MTSHKTIEKWAITFSRWPKINDMKEWRDIMMPCTYIKVSEEAHEDPPKDDSPHKSMVHYHMFVFPVRKDFNKSKLIAWAKGIWPDDYKRIDIQTIRRDDSWLNYIGKLPLRSFESGENPVLLRKQRVAEGWTKKKKCIDKRTDEEIDGQIHHEVRVACQVDRDIRDITIAEIKRINENFPYLYKEDEFRKATSIYDGWEKNEQLRDELMERGINCKMLVYEDV